VAAAGERADAEMAAASAKEAAVTAHDATKSKHVLKAVGASGGSGGGTALERALGSESLVGGFEDDECDFGDEPAGNASGLGSGLGSGLSLGAGTTALAGEPGSPLRGSVASGQRGAARAARYQRVEQLERMAKALARHVSLTNQFRRLGVGAPPEPEPLIAPWQGKHGSDGGGRGLSRRRSGGIGGNVDDEASGGDDAEALPIDSRCVGLFYDLDPRSLESVPDLDAPTSPLRAPRPLGMNVLGGPESSAASSASSAEAAPRAGVALSGSDRGGETGGGSYLSAAATATARAASALRSPPTSPLGPRAATGEGPRSPHRNGAAGGGGNGGTAPRVGLEARPSSPTLVPLGEVVWLLGHCRAVYAREAELDALARQPKRHRARSARVIAFLLRPRDRTPLAVLKARHVYRLQASTYGATMLDVDDGRGAHGAAGKDKEHHHQPQATAPPEQQKEKRDLVDMAMHSLAKVGDSMAATAEATAASLNPSNMHLTSPVVTYEMLVTKANDATRVRSRWHIKRRYNDFKELHRALLRESARAAHHHEHDHDAERFAVPNFAANFGGGGSSSGGGSGSGSGGGGGSSGGGGRAGGGAVSAAAAAAAERRRRRHALPPLPPKKALGNTEREFVALRKRKLGEYLAALLVHPVFGGCHELVLFLDAQKDIEPAAVGSLGNGGGGGNSRGGPGGGVANGVEAAFAPALGGGEGGATGAAEASGARGGKSQGAGGSGGSNGGSGDGNSGNSGGSCSGGGGDSWEGDAFSGGRARIGDRDASSRLVAGTGAWFGHEAGLWGARSRFESEAVVMPWREGGEGGDRCSNDDGDEELLPSFAGRARSGAGGAGSASWAPGAGGAGDAGGAGEGGASAEAAEAEDTRKVMDELQLRTIQKRIFSILKELFEMDRRSLVRRNVLGLIRKAVKVALTGTISKALAAAAVRFGKPEVTARFLHWLVATIWSGPGQTMGPRLPPPTEVMKSARAIRLRDELVAAVPGTFASLLGVGACEEAVAKLYEFLQCGVLLRSLLYSALDLLWQQLFPEEPALRDLYGMDLEFDEK